MQNKLEDILVERINYWLDNSQCDDAQAHEMIREIIYLLNLGGYKGNVITTLLCDS